jgi:hypothetical protein
MQFRTYNQQYPPLPNIPWAAQQTTGFVYGNQNATHTITNSYTPTAFDALSEEETLAENSTDLNNANTWQIIKKRKRYTTQPQTDIGFKIDTRNQFQALLTDTNPGMDVVNSTHPEPRPIPTNEPKPPPIYVHDVTNYKAMADNLAVAVSKENYHTKTLTNNTVVIYPHKPEIYRRLISHLREHQIVYHTYQLKQDRAYRVVIRDIHPSVPPQEIADEINSKGHQVRNIVNIRHRLTKEPLPLFFVDLEPKENNKEIYDLHYLYNTKIRVEPPRTRKDIIQCTRCQEYGHSKSYCNRPYYCVKCGQQHDTKTCTKPHDTPATCALCQGSHPANYKGCTVYKELINARNKRNPRQLTPQTNPTKHNLHTPPTQDKNMHYNNPNESSSSYAQIVTSRGPSNCNAYDTQFTTFLTEFKNMFSQLLQQNNMILTMLTTVINKLAK